MRGAFNKLTAVFYGERSVVGPPLTQYAADIPCRVVPQTRIGQEQFPFDLSEVWITLDALTLNGPFVSSPWPGATFTDYLAADLVRFGEPGDPLFYVCRAEHVVPFAEPDYRRYLLIQQDDTEVPPWLASSPPPPAPPGPPVPPPVEPGTACESPTILPGTGDYVISTQPSALNGYYAVELDPDTDIYVEVLAFDPLGGQIDVTDNVPEGSCCFGSLIGVLREDVDSCISAGPSGFSEFRGRLCIVIGTSLPPFPAVSATIRIGYGTCPV